MKEKREARMSDTATTSVAELHTSTTTADDRNDQSQPPRLSKEQLRNLLSDFLDQLITLPPPAATNESVESGVEAEFNEWRKP